MKIGILISGRGSNMVALVDAIKSGEIPDSEVAVVISDTASAVGLEKAKERGVETLVIKRNGRTREEHDAEIANALRKRDVELVCLAGYMRLLSKDFIHAFENRIVNIHPSLLPAFPGLDAQRQALEHGVKITGCTVHYVNEDLDAGPIILQKAVEVCDDDTVETLSARILERSAESRAKGFSLRFPRKKLSDLCVEGFLNAEVAEVYAKFAEMMLTFPP
jgi:phosphoribosylglycinamide formyltransferase 1